MTIIIENLSYHVDSTWRTYMEAYQRTWAMNHNHYAIRRAEAMDSWVVFEEDNYNSPPIEVEEKKGVCL